jgi:hypothetical protein
MAKQKQDSSTLGLILAGQLSKSEKRTIASRSIRESNAKAHAAVKAVKLAAKLAS